ncbi:hypothetical protein OUZ56_022701 [Daphnia magna]|uniref:Secreted protein n=1 Tax=Daphnia magna TaxID=35525 RepID=A0ABR0AX69_9CRUS|nr:hypothetical protein OUZ56_022701 [Daphnia magna]
MDGCAAVAVLLQLCPTCRQISFIYFDNNDKRDRKSNFKVERNQKNQMMESICLEPLCYSRSSLF